MTFEDVLEIKNGRNQRAVENPEGKYPIYGSGGIMGYANDYICDAQTVIVGRKGSINNPLYVEEPFWNVDTAFGLCANRDILLPRYLYYFCKKFDFERLNKAVTIPSLTKSDLLKIEIDLPRLEEQQETVNKLIKIEQVIDLRKQELEELDNLIKSRFVEMFGDPVSNPRGWNIASCKEISSKIGSGATPKGGRESYGTEGITLIRSMNVYNNKFEYKDLAYITDEQAHKLDNVIIEENDVLLNITGASVARCCMVPSKLIPARVNQHVAIIRCKSDVLPAFVSYMLTNASYQRLLWNIATSGGATREAITKQQIEQLQFIVPPITIQQEFVQYAIQVDKLKFEVQKSLKETQILMDSLMQRYFG